MDSSTSAVVPHSLQGTVATPGSAACVLDLGWSVFETGFWQLVMFSCSKTRSPADIVIDEEGGGQELSPEARQRFRRALSKLGRGCAN